MIQMGRHSTDDLWAEWDNLIILILKIISPIDSPKIDHREHIEERNYKVTEKMIQSRDKFGTGEWWVSI